jgi:ABC-2 type transport system permease protein
VLLHIMKFDLKNLLAERSLPAVVLTLVLLLGYGAYNGAQWAQHQRDTLEEIQRDYAARMTGLPAKMRKAPEQNLPPFLDPRTPSVVANREAPQFLALPPLSSAALAIGQSDLYPYYVKASTLSASAVLGADEIENPDNLLFGRFDLGFVLVYLYPLLILALSYNVLSAEREQGTLSLTMAQPVRLSTLVLGKLASRGAVMLVLTLLIAMIAMLSTGGSLLSPEFLLWVCTLLAYTAFWFSLAVLVNAVGHSSAANAMALVVAWVGLSLIVPSALHLLAGTLYPVPSRVEMIHSMREATREATAKGAAVLARYLEDHPELVPGGAANAADAASKSLALQQETDRLMVPVLRRFDEQLERQRQMLRSLQYLSPTILTQSAMNDLAGSSTERFEHFRRQVVTFVAAWRLHFARYVLGRQMLQPDDLSRLPRFQLQDEPRSLARQRVLLCVLGILGLTSLVSIAASIQLRRYRAAA